MLRNICECGITEGGPDDDIELLIERAEENQKIIARYNATRRMVRNEKYSLETAVGVFVLIGIICIAYMTIKLGKVTFIEDNYYPSMPISPRYPA